MEQEAYIFPTSFAQERLWLLDQLEPGNNAYHISTAIRLSGPINMGALEQSLNEIVRRHESLRTSFSATDEGPVQVITPALTLDLPVIDLQSLPEAERENEARRLLAKGAAQPFDLARGPLLRAVLLRLDKDDHVLLLTMHHIVSDGWSLGILRRELSTLYEAFSRSEASPLVELPIQYGDFAVWQREWLQGDVLEALLTYWKAQLEGAPPVLELPTDRARPPLQTHSGAWQSITLSMELTKALKKLGRQEGATLFMTLLAAFQALLCRYTGQRDIVVGSPIANRTQAEIEGLIGFFVNTLVLRTDLNGDPTFRQLLGRVRDVCLEAYTHQDLPFEKLVEEIQPDRNLSYNPLFQVMCVLQNAPESGLELTGLRKQRFPLGRSTAQFDLSLFMWETQEGLSANLVYNTDLFDIGTIERMLGHFRVLLESIVAEPERTVSQLPMLTEEEQHLLLVEWNRTRTDYPSNTCIHELFEAQVQRTPKATAVVFEDKNLSYRELNEQANRLAHYLQRVGVGPGDLVGICMERSLEMVVGLLGILKAGGAYVPLDPTYPRERIALMLDDIQSPVLLTQRRLAEALPACDAEVMCLDADWDAMMGESEENPAAGALPENPVYVIYTSGSTGKPKGVVNRHRGLTNRLVWMQKAYQLGVGDRVVQKTPFTFDVSVWEFFWPLMTGARLVMARPEGHKDSAYLVNLICEEKITTVHFVPSMLQVFLEERGIERCGSIRRVICSGEALPYDLQERFFTRLEAELHNLYGPTEAAVDVTYWACRGQDDRHVVPIGRPIANTQIYLLDGHLNPVPTGVPGVLHIGGDGLARGYLRRPGLTAERFIPNLYGDEPGGRLYNTGDLARYLPDGNIEFLGRVDHQVKVRGFRIELGEIEAALFQHPAVREAVVLAREDVPGDKRLVAYVVPHQEPAPASGDLRRFLKRRLPEHMVPAAYVALETLPLTANGKVDRSKLPPSDGSRLDLEQAFVAPRTRAEEELAGIWAEVLGIEQVGIHDNFFDLGGHSLLAVRLIAHVNRKFSTDLPLIALFQAPTVAQLAAVLGGDEQQKPEAFSSLVNMQAGGTRPPLFVLPGNMGNVFTDLGHLARHLGPDQPFYGLQDGLGHPARIQHLAAHYVEEIRRLRPEGPYLLCGICSGAVIAFEMAQQLRAQGQGVPFLAMVDPSPIQDQSLGTYFRFGRSVFRRFGRRLGHHAQEVAQQQPAYQGAYLRLRMKVVANWWAVVRYAPRSYPGRIELFLTEASFRSPGNRQQRWRNYALEEAELHQIPGDHAAIVGLDETPIEEAHMEVLAEKMVVCIDKALSDG